MFSWQAIDFEAPGSICAMCSHRECTCGESDLSAGSDLDDDALEVIWLSLDNWRQETGYTSLCDESILKEYMGEDKGLRDYTHGKWYKILPSPSEPQSSTASSSAATAVEEDLWNESDLIRYMMTSGSVQSAFGKQTPSLERKHIFQLLEDVKHKVPRELYNKCWQTFDETL